MAADYFTDSTWECTTIDMILSALLYGTNRAELYLLPIDPSPKTFIKSSVIRNAIKCSLGYLGLLCVWTWTKPLTVSKAVKQFSLFPRAIWILRRARVKSGQRDSFLKCRRQLLRLLIVQLLISSPSYHTQRNIKPISWSDRKLAVFYFSSIGK